MEPDNFYRLFTVPGMGHCGVSASLDTVSTWAIFQSSPLYCTFGFSYSDVASLMSQGGPGAAAFGNSGQRPLNPPSSDDPTHDVLSAMVNWVENDIAPSEIIATKW
jgi:feruloyl esterase